jgi:hypothetical protein
MAWSSVHSPSVESAVDEWLDGEKKRLAQLVRHGRRARPYVFGILFTRPMPMPRQKRSSRPSGSLLAPARLLLSLSCQ